MNLETKQEYEANGILVREQAYLDPHFRTKTFITVPGYEELPSYDVFYQIPQSLNEGDNFWLASTAVHPEDRRDNETIIWDLSNTMGDPTLEPMTIIGLAWLLIKIIGTVIIFLCIYYILNLLFNPHPCGPQGDVEVINDCYKKIIFPDCAWKLFNSCAGPDNNGDGFPDGVVEDEGDAPPNYAELLLYGVLAVGGIVVLMTLMRGRSSEKYYTMHPEERPAPKRGWLERQYYK